MPKSKSAYSVPTKKEKPETYIFVVWVDNEAGVLARVVGLFSGRGYNIESLAVAEVDAIKQINSMRLASEAHDAQQKEEAVFVQKMYGQPAQDDNLEL